MQATNMPAMLERPSLEGAARKRKRKRKRPRRRHSKNPSTTVLSQVVLFLLLKSSAMGPWAAAMSVRSVLFPADPGIGTQPPGSFVAFVHGRLEADDDSNNYSNNGDDDDLQIPVPAILYSDFCKGLAASMNRDVLLVDYHEEYRHWRREPRDFGLGPVSSAVGAAIREHAAKQQQQHNSSSNRGDPVATVEDHPVPVPVPAKITLVSFSMGAAIVLKLLASDPWFKTTSLSSSANAASTASTATTAIIEAAVLVEPVWRCWLPFAVSRAAEVRHSPVNSNSNNSAQSSSLAISDVPCLALVGSHDAEVRDDSGAFRGGSGSNLAPRVEKSLQPFLSNGITADSIEGGNHFGLCSGPPDLLEFAAEGLAPGLRPETLRRELIDRITEFCATASEE